MEDPLVFHPDPGTGWHGREIFAAVTTHSHTLKSFDPNFAIWIFLLKIG